MKVMTHLARLSRLFIFVVCFSGLFTLSYGNGPTPAGERLQSFGKHMEMKENSIFGHLKWNNIGPYFMGGRITDIEGYENNPNTFLVATASGGLWLTENNATTWTPIFDRESSITIGDIAVSQTDGNLIWVGTGEQNSSRSSYAGTGVFKSTDGGKTFRNMGLTDSHHIGRVLIHPKDNNIVYVAVIGHLYTENQERGLFKTSDGGKTWEKVLYISPKTGIIDVVMQPSNTDILLAAAWQRDRKAWNFVECGPESGMFKSTDGGKTWKKAMTGFPQNEFAGRIGLDFSRSKPNVVYAYLDNQEPKPRENKKNKKGADANRNLFNTNIKGAELYRSNDGGETWAKTHSTYLDGVVHTYGYYFGQVRVDPKNEDIVYIQGVPLMKSEDGGKTFKNISKQGGIYGVRGVHADMQAMWIDPNDPNRLLLGNDGGLNISYDQGKFWQKINNLPLAQCYTINYDNNTPYNIYTGLQDNGVNMGPSTFTLSRRDLIWKSILGGDGAFVQPQPGDTGIVFAEFQFGYLFRIDINNSRNNRLIRPRSKDKKNPYRFNWLSPFFISPHNSHMLYMGGNKVLMSPDMGEHWNEISSDLTNRQNTGGDVPFATIVSLDESPMVPGLLYAGTDDGNVWVRQAPREKWQLINQGLPKKWVTRLVASKFKKERVYLTQIGYREDDFKAYVFMSEDYGKTWTSIKGNLPEEGINVIREDPVNPSVLYLGTDLTVYVSIDRGKNWYSLRNNLPTNAVYDLRVHPREKELMIGTHGRGVFLLPVNIIQQMSVGILNKPFHLFALPREVKVSGAGSGRPRGNPAAPIPITFYSDSRDQYTWSIKNVNGDEIFRSRGKAVKGLNCFSWNLDLKLNPKVAKKNNIKENPGRRKKAGKGVYTLVVKKGKSKAERQFRIL